MPTPMSESSEQYLRQAITTLSQSDPLIKLLHEVKLGRMKATDAGLRAITQAWLSTYQQVLEKGDVLTQPALRRLDPTPRLEVLIEAGVITDDHPAVAGLRTTFRQVMADRHA